MPTLIYEMHIKAFSPYTTYSRECLILPFLGGSHITLTCFFHISSWCQMSFLSLYHPVNCSTPKARGFEWLGCKSGARFKSHFMIYNVMAPLKFYFQIGFTAPFPAVAEYTVSDLCDGSPQSAHMLRSKGYSIWSAIKIQTVWMLLVYLYSSRCIG